MTTPGEARNADPHEGLGHAPLPSSSRVGKEQAGHRQIDPDLADRTVELLLPVGDKPVQRALATPA